MAHWYLSYNVFMTLLNRYIVILSNITFLTVIFIATEAAAATDMAYSLESVHIFQPS